MNRPRRELVCVNTMPIKSENFCDETVTSLFGNAKSAPPSCGVTSRKDEFDYLVPVSGNGTSITSIGTSMNVNKERSQNHQVSHNFDNPTLSNMPDGINTLMDAENNVKHQHCEPWVTAAPGPEDSLQFKIFGSADIVGTKVPAGEYTYEVRPTTSDYTCPEKIDDARLRPVYATKLAPELIYSAPIEDEGDGIFGWRRAALRWLNTKVDRQTAEKFLASSSYDAGAFLLRVEYDTDLVLSVKAQNNSIAHFKLSRSNDRQLRLDSHYGGDSSKAAFTDLHGLLTFYSENPIAKHVPKLSGCIPAPSSDCRPDPNLAYSPQLGTSIMMLDNQQSTYCEPSEMV